MQNELSRYILLHTETTLDTVPNESAADVVFFRVMPREAPDPQELRRLLIAQAGEAGSVKVLDGKEHSYVELGGWLGSQSLALRLMGLGQQLGLWQLLTPYSVLGELVSPEAAHQMAAGGMVTVLAKPVP